MNRVPWAGNTAPVRTRQPSGSLASQPTDWGRPAIARLTAALRAMTSLRNAVKSGKERKNAAALGRICSASRLSGSIHGTLASTSAWSTWFFKPPSAAWSGSLPAIASSRTFRNRATRSTGSIPGWVRTWSIRSSITTSQSIWVGSLKSIGLNLAASFVCGDTSIFSTQSPTTWRVFSLPSKPTR